MSLWVIYLILGVIVLLATSLSIYNFLSGNRLIRDVLHYLKVRKVSLETCDQYYSKNENISEIIISLTTIPERIEDLQLVCKSLLVQTLRPKSINLYIPYHSYRNGKEYIIPEYLKNLENITIHRVENDFGPATKSIPAIITCEQDQLILVVDDDNIYPETYVEDLAEASEVVDNKIISVTGWRVPEDLIDKPTTLWSNINMIPPTPVLGTRLKIPYQVDIVQGYSGYLLKPKYFNIDELIDYDSAPVELRFVDDVWISAKSKVAKVVWPVRRKSYTAFFKSGNYKQSSLAKINNWGKEDYSKRNNSIGIRFFQNEWLFNSEQI